MLLTELDEGTTSPEFCRVYNIGECTIEVIVYRKPMSVSWSLKIMAIGSGIINFTTLFPSDEDAFYAFVSFVEREGFDRLLNITSFTNINICNR